MRTIYAHTGRAVALAALGLAGCGGAPVPVARVSATEAAIRAARETGADSTPNAALHLHYAEVQRAAAQRELRSNPQRAALTLRRAEADADLAVALARQQTAQREARAAEEALHGPPDAPAVPR